MGNTFSNSSADALLARIFLFMRRSSYEKINKPIKAYQVKERLPEWTDCSKLRGLANSRQLIQLISKL
jgi:hypothetical protein